MKKIFLFLLPVLLGYFLFTGQKSSDSKGQIEAPPIWNIHKLTKWYTDRGFTPPQYVAIELNSSKRPNEVDANDGPDVRVFPTSNPQSENSIAISQFNPLNAFISTNMAGTQSYFFTSNGGASWFGSESDPGGYTNFGDPVALFDVAGNAYWGTLTSPGGVGITKTTNLGASWGPLMYADPVSNTNNDKEHMMTDLSGTNPNNIYVGFCDFNLTGPPISFVSSTNSGTTWSGRTNLGIGTNRGQGVNIQVGPNGEVYVAWAHYTAGTAEVGIGFAKSTNAGSTFNTPAVAFAITGIRTSNAGVPEFNNSRVSSFPSMSVDRSTGPRRGWIYVVYPDRSTGDADVYVNISTNGGTTWGSKIRVNGETVGNGKQQWMASSACDATNGALSVSYYSMDSTGFLTARYLATSLDGGTTWDRTKISDVRFTAGPISGFAAGYMGDYYETAAYAGKVIPTWSDNRSGSWQAYVSPISLGPSINHTPLGNTENLSGPYTVNAIITPAGSGIDPSKTKLYWSRNNPVITDSLLMTNTSGNNWTGNIPGNGSAATYRYYIKATDSLGRTATAPSGAPGTLYSFVAQLDLVKPVITHTPLTDQPKPNWPATVTATVTDNIGIDSSWVVWYKNTPVPTKEFKLINTSGSTFSAPFNSLNSDVVIGDFIFYKIFAQDNSIAHNRDSTALYSFKIIDVKLCEGFFSATFPPSGWNIEFTGTNYWTRNTVSSYGIGAGSAKFDFWSATAGTIQSLVTLTFSNTVSGDSLRFDDAYAPYSSGTDSLSIQTSTNSGTSYSTLVRLYGNATSGIGGNSLNTTTTNTSIFTPTSAQWATRKYSLPVGTNKIKFRAYSGFGNNLYLDTICVVNNVAPVPSTFTLAEQGFYNTSTNTLNMKDTVKVYLRTTTAPYVIVDSGKTVIDSISLSGSLTFNNAATGTYYIMVRHRNSVETWSKSGGESYVKGTPFSYNFTTAATQAFGNNLILVGPKYCIYSGDVNQDYLVELSDILQIYNDALIFATGYVVTDVTGDGFVDLSDLTIAYNNSTNFVGRQAPPGAEPQVTKQRVKQVNQINLQNQIDKTRKKDTVKNPVSDTEKKNLK